MAEAPLDFITQIANVQWGGLAVEFGDKDKDAPKPEPAPLRTSQR
jgi:hypothetical protein